MLGYKAGPLQYLNMGHQLITDLAILKRQIAIIGYPHIPLTLCKGQILTDDEEEDGPYEITFRVQNGEETITIDATAQSFVNDPSVEGDNWSTTTYSSSGKERKYNQVQCLDDWSDDETYPQVDGLPRSSKPVKEEEHWYTSDYSSNQEGLPSGQGRFIDSKALSPKAGKVLQEEAGPFGAEQIQKE